MTKAMMNRVVLIILLFFGVSAFASGDPNLDEAYLSEWTQAGELIDCNYCRTEEFHQTRKVWANQVRPVVNKAGTAGKIVRIIDGVPRKRGEATLFGFGNLISTDAHVLFKDDGRQKPSDDGAIYFEPWLEPGKLYRLEMDSAIAGCKMTSGHERRHCDWAVVRLEKDVIEDSKNSRIFASFWNLKFYNHWVHDEHFRKGLTVVDGAHGTYRLYDKCAVPRGFSSYERPQELGYGTDQILFLPCPVKNRDSGKPGLAKDKDGLINVAFQFVAKEDDIPISGSSNGQPEITVPPTALAFPVEKRAAMNNLYLKEIIRRYDIDPRNY